MGLTNMERTISTQRADALEAPPSVKRHSIDLTKNGLVLAYFFGCRDGWVSPDKVTRADDSNPEKLTGDEPGSPTTRRSRLSQIALEEAYEWQKEILKKKFPSRRSSINTTDKRQFDTPALKAELKEFHKALKRMLKADVKKYIRRRVNDADDESSDSSSSLSDSEEELEQKKVAKQTGGRPGARNRRDAKTSGDGVPKSAKRASSSAGVKSTSDSASKADMADNEQNKTENEKGEQDVSNQHRTPDASNNTKPARPSKKRKRDALVKSKAASESSGSGDEEEDALRSVFSSSEEDEVDVVEPYTPSSVSVSAATPVDTPQIDPSEKITTTIETKSEDNNKEIVDVVNDLPTSGTSTPTKRRRRRRQDILDLDEIIAGPRRESQRAEKIKAKEKLRMEQERLHRENLKERADTKRDKQRAARQARQRAEMATHTTEPMDSTESTITDMESGGLPEGSDALPPPKRLKKSSGTVNKSLRTADDAMETENTAVEVDTNTKETPNNEKESNEMKETTTNSNATTDGVSTASSLTESSTSTVTNAVHEAASDLSSLAAVANAVPVEEVSTTPETVTNQRTKSRRTDTESKGPRAKGNRAKAVKNNRSENTTNRNKRAQKAVTKTTPLAVSSTGVLAGMAVPLTGPSPPYSTFAMPNSENTLKSSVPLHPEEDSAQTASQNSVQTQTSLSLQNHAEQQRQQFESWWQQQLLILQAHQLRIQEQSQGGTARKRKQYEPLDLPICPCPTCFNPSFAFEEDFVPSGGQLFDGFVRAYRPHRSDPYSSSLHVTFGLYSHHIIENHIANLSTRTKTFGCKFPQCNEAFYSQLELDQHIDAHVRELDQQFFTYTSPTHNTTPSIASSNSSTTMPSPTNAFTKPLPTTSSSLGANLQASQPTDGSAITCPYPRCGATFGGDNPRRAWRQHVETVHLGIERKPCEDCGTSLYVRLPSSESVNSEAPSDADPQTFALAFAQLAESNGASVSVSQSDTNANTFTTPFPTPSLPASETDINAQRKSRVRLTQTPKRRTVRRNRDSDPDPTTDSAYALSSLSSPWSETQNSTTNTAATSSGFTSFSTPVGGHGFLAQRVVTPTRSSAFSTSNSSPPSVPPISVVSDITDADGMTALMGLVDLCAQEIGKS